MTKIDLVAVVKEHALAHYNEGGRDVIVECWDDKEIAEHLTNCKARTRKHAIVAFSDLISVWKDQQDDARNSAF